MNNNVWNLTIPTVTWCVFQNSLFFQNEQGRSNITMDDSSVAEEPNFSSLIISSVAEEPLISALIDDKFSEGKETIRISR